MTACKKLGVAVLLVAVVGLGRAQTSTQPHVGYVFPAGGCQGTTIEVLVGGQSLRGAVEPHITGEGVEGTVVKHYSLRRNLMPEQRQMLRDKVDELREKLLAKDPAAAARLRPRGRAQRPAAKKDDTDASVPFPEHPLLRNLESMNLRQLQHVEDELLGFQSLRKKQQNAQLGEAVLVRLTIAADAEPGDREFRMQTAQGLSNPICFQIGTLPEACEVEPNDPGSFPILPADPPAKLPILLNGQVMPGDVDRLPFLAKAGQTLVIQVQARHLIPYLADAVPGWFQATVALINPRGEEVAFADDYRFDPDPVLFYEVPKDGVYELEIRDSIYRGREDFVYRVSISEQPFVTSLYPLGAKTGQRVVAKVDGCNLPSDHVVLDTRPGDWGVRHVVMGKGKTQSNAVPYVVDSMPEAGEAEPNDDVAGAQLVLLPRTVNGRIGQPGDVDVYRFRGQRHQEVVVEVQARSLGSPLDSLVRLLDAKGQVIAWNDDYSPREAGFLYTGDGELTHHADSYLRAELPKDGNYYVQVSDTCSHGGDIFAYRLRLSEPQPDFALRMSPSSLSLSGGKTVPITIHVLRRDGFDGPVELGLKDAPEGMVLAGGRVPAGQNEVRVTLTAPKEVATSPCTFEVEGRARIGDATVAHTACPVDDVMQAFLYRHLAPAEDFEVNVQSSKWAAPKVDLEGASPVRLVAGATTEVRLKMPPRKWIQRVEIAFSDPPKGVSVGEVRVLPTGLAFDVKLDQEAPAPGFASNLIMEAYGEVEVKPAPAKDKGKGKAKEAAVEDEAAAPTTRRISLGYFPAIPFEIVQR